MTRPVTYGPGGAARAAEGAVNAPKTVDVIADVESQDFHAILEKVDEPLVVHSPGTLWTKHKYLTSYKGLVFFTKSKDALLIPASVEMVTAKKILLPQM